MNTKNIILVHGEPKSVFSEIIAKLFKSQKNLRSKIIFIGSQKLLKSQLDFLKYKIRLNSIENIKKAKQNVLNIINVDCKFQKPFELKKKLSNIYIKKCFEVALKITTKEKNLILINGPISKKSFLNKKFLGITEYLSKKTNSKNEVMLIYNKNLSVSPVTTHLPIKFVSESITRKAIINNIRKNNSFFLKRLGIKCKIAVLGLNPHCESIEKISEESKTILPVIKKLKKEKIDISGPFSADTFFLNKNLKKYNLVVGMYHDQVLTPIKTLYNFKAVNITIGLPFIRISPDHGPNEEMVGQKKSDPASLIYALKLVNKLKNI